MKVVIKKLFPGIEYELDDILIADAVSALYQSVMRRKYESNGDDNHFTGYFFNVIKRQMYNSLNDKTSFEHPAATITPSRVIHPLDVENHIYLEQLPGFIRDAVVARIRFTGRELQACMYVLDRLLTGSNIVSAYLKRGIGVQDPEFFVTYIVVLMRSSIYDLKIRGGRYVLNDVFSNRFAFE